MSGTTTIEITTEQKSALNKMGFGSYKAALQELLDNYNGHSQIDEDRVREIAAEVVEEQTNE